MLFSVSLLGNLTSFLADVAKSHTLVTLRWLLQRGYLELSRSRREELLFLADRLTTSRWPKSFTKGLFWKLFRYKTLYQSEVGKSLRKSRCENDIFPIYKSVERMLEPQVANQVSGTLTFWKVNQKKKEMEV